MAVASMNGIVSHDLGKGVFIVYSPTVISAAVAVLMGDDARFVFCENMSSHTDRLHIVVVLVYCCITGSAVRHTAV